MLRIHGHAGSINVRKVLWACNELSIPFAREDRGGPFHGTSEPAFLAINPFGLIPAIEDDGIVLSESNAIVRYLAASRGRDDLLPPEPSARALIEMWMDWQASDCNNRWRVAFQALVRKNPAIQDREAIERSMNDFSHMVGTIDAQLTKTGGYICGPQFTVADIAIGLSIHRWRAMPWDLPAFAAVESYYARLSERPGFRRYGCNGGP
jgi:glutathione S-transferase